jgi:sulfur carrier protein ThiS
VILLASNNPNQKESILKVLFINNDGAGFADYVEIETDTTVKAFFNDRCRGEASSYLIRVNRQPVASDYILQPNDRITITPTKIEGARCKIA